MLLVYRPPRYMADALLELADVVSDVVLRTPRLLVLGDLNIHAKAVLSGPARDFRDTMTTLGLPQEITDPIHVAGHTLNLFFWTNGDRVLGIRDVATLPLSWTDR